MTPDIFLINFKFYTLMKKEDFLNDEFLKQFKTGEELTGFLKSIQKRGVEKNLEGELDAHLDYEKHQKSTNLNSRNGYSTKKIKTSLARVKLKFLETENHHLIQ